MSADELLEVAERVRGAGVDCEVEYPGYLRIPGYNAGEANGRFVVVGALDWDEWDLPGDPHCAPVVEDAVRLILEVVKNEPMV